jgi:hypothetical protein
MSKLLNGNWKKTFSSYIGSCGDARINTAITLHSISETQNKGISTKPKSETGFCTTQFFPFLIIFLNRLSFPTLFPVGLDLERTRVFWLWNSLSEKPVATIPSLAMF